MTGESKKTATVSAVETIKENSDYLRGNIVTGLASNITGAVSDNDQALIKFHGIYQQDNRDNRNERMHRKLEPDYSFMIRLRVPGGLLTAEQWLAVDAVAETLSESGSLRLTTRQTLQFHGVAKKNLAPLLAACAKQLLDSIAACGDVNRNVMSSSHAGLSVIHAQAYETAVAISAHLLPKSRAYYEIWLGEERLISSEEDEPLYGKHYLPRKFKIAVAVPPVNDVDVYAQDIGFIAVAENSVLAGFNVVAGGGLGMTYGDTSTYPRLASDVGFCRPEQAPEVAWHVAAWQRDNGNRNNRKQARLKYTIDREGIGVFRRDLESRLGFALAPMRPVAWHNRDDRLGWYEREDGYYDLGLFVENGRIAAGPLKDALKEIATLGVCRFLMTPNQNLLLVDIAPAARKAVRGVLTKYNFSGDEAGEQRKRAMACVALPTCPLAMAEAERYLPNLITRLESMLASLGLAKAGIDIRMTGCPNGCARPYLGEIGLIGKSPSHYNLFLGASHTGERLSAFAGGNMDEEMILSYLAPLFKAYAAKRWEGERFGDFLVREKIIRSPSMPSDFHSPG